MNLLKFAKHIQNILDTCESKDFAKIFVEAKSESFRKYHNGMIISTAHGVNFFKNVIQFWDNPELYCNKPEQTYEYNFVKIIKNNK